jgi:nucleoid DNA-binding protein
MEQGDTIRLGVGSFHMKERGPKPVQDFKTNTRFIMGPTNKVIYTPSAYVKTTVKKADLKLQTLYEAELKNGKANAK